VARCLGGRRAPLGRSRMSGSCLGSSLAEPLHDRLQLGAGDAKAVECIAGHLSRHLALAEDHVIHFLGEQVLPLTATCMLGKSSALL
jgi:hypothetical protein